MGKQVQLVPNLIDFVAFQHDEKLKPGLTEQSFFDDCETRLVEYESATPEGKARMIKARNEYLTYMGVGAVLFINHREKLPWGSMVAPYIVDRAVISNQSLRQTIRLAIRQTVRRTIRSTIQQTI